MKKVLIISLSMVAAVVVGTAQGAQADSGTTRVTKGVLSPAHAHDTVTTAPADTSCNALSRACHGNRGTDAAFDASKSTRLLAQASATNVTKGQVSSFASDTSRVAISEQAIEDPEDVEGTLDLESEAL